MWSAHAGKKTGSRSDTERIYLAPVSNRHSLKDPMFPGSMSPGRRSQYPAEEATTARLLSAGRMRVSELTNKVVELNRRLDSLKVENRELKRHRHGLENRLQHYEGKEGVAPSLVQRQVSDAHETHDDNYALGNSLEGD
jgi:predicted RNase H-like nuclease (RuvC/YqgF family)